MKLLVHHGADPKVKDNHGDKSTQAVHPISGC